MRFQFLLVLLPSVLSAALGVAQQHTSTVPSTYRGPVLNSICIASIDGTNGMTSAIFAVSGYYRSDAERAWAKYALAQNGNAPLKGTRCVWSTTPIDPAKVNITSQNGGQVKQTGWKFDPQTMLPAASIASSTTIPSATAATPSANTTGTQSTAAAVPTSAAASAAAPGTAVGSGTAAAPTTGLSSISQNAQQSMQDAKNSATTAVTGSVNTVTTTTVQSVTGAMTSGIASMQTSLLNRFHKKSAAAQPTSTDGTQTVAAGPGTPAVGTAPAPPTLAASAMPPSAAAVGSVPGSSAGALTFVFCHLVASGNEYVSEIFPSTGPVGSTMESSFWQFVGTQYHLTNIPYRNNVACVRSGNENESVAALQTLKTSAAQRGVAANHVVDTGWTFSGATP